MRTIVCSDLHGRPGVFAAILKHAGFTQGTDRLVIAGDLGDDRAGDAEVLAMAESLEADVVIGNHEVMHLDGLYTYHEDAFRADVVLDRVMSGAWSMAVEVDGVLVTHAGVSAAYARRNGLAGFSAAEIAEWLNEEGRLAALRLRDGDSPFDEDIEIFSLNGPTWFYPEDSGAPLSSVVQVTGHRVPGYQLTWSEVAGYEQDGFYHIDPGVRIYGHRNPPHVRYAIIDEGEVTVVDD